MSVLQTGFGNSGGDYTISRSVRLRSSATAYFSRTPASASNRKTWTWSAWVKRGSLGSYQYLLHCGTTSATGNYGDFGFDNSDKFYLGVWAGPVIITNRAFRDPSAWYHIVVAVDTTQATSSNRIKLYVNGVQETSFSTDTISTYYTLNYDTAINQALQHSISGRQPYTSDGYFDGYSTEINFVDGQQLTPSSFGETDTITGVWKPKRYTGTYGTNGFYLNFSDNSNNTAATIGKDSSGNGNNWTPNNISVTAGSTYDSMLDTPTPYADGGNGRGNYAVWNVLKSPASYGTITNGNLTTTANTSGNELNAISSMSSTTGKWYAEFTVQQANTSRPYIGIQAVNQYQIYTGANLAVTSNTVDWVQDGRVYANGSLVGTFATFTTGDVVCVAVDCDNGAIYYRKNNDAWINSGSPTSGASRTGSLYNWTGGTIDFAFYIGDYYAGNITNANFGQRPFSYTPPTGFKALNTQNLPDSTIKKGSAYFDATTYTGTGATQTIVNSGGMQPDFVWTKARSAAIGHLQFDSVRGATKYLQSASTAAEGTGTDSLTAFAINGFTVGADTSTTGVNQNTTTYVGWQWKAGGAAVSNTSGSITSSVSAGATQGFSVATFTAPSSNQSFTVGHGLGVAPKMTIIKRRDSSTGGDWWTWHIGIGDNTTDYLALDLTSAETSTANMWGTVGRTSTVCGFNAPASIITNGTYVMYNFTDVAGYSKFGSYTGNGSADGTFVYLGFRPRYVLYKNASLAGTSWAILDSSRNTYNVENARLFADSSSAEDTSVSPMDFTSNGFKVRSTNDGVNRSGDTIIYMAFAENPTKYSLAR